MIKNTLAANDVVPVDNSIYDRLGDRWYEAYDDPVALLRAESKVKEAWIEKRLPVKSDLKILDQGCGAGFVSNSLARKGHDLTGVDLSQESLVVARKHAPNSKVKYIEADALATGLPDNYFDVVVSLDFLEHVEDPAASIMEAARVLKPGGLYFFHTFNRNLLSWLTVIKLVEWFVPNTPKHMHVLRLFIKPSELASYCHNCGLEPTEWTGIRPELFTFSNLTGIFKRRVPEDFSFKLTESKLMSYMGMARKPTGRIH